MLLRACLGVGKVMFNLRTVDTVPHQEILDSFDSDTLEALTCILGSPVTDLQWQQAALATSQGGLGLRAAADHAAAAYTSSLLACQPLVRDLLGVTAEEAARAIVPPAVLAQLSTKAGEELTEESTYGLSQKVLSGKVERHLHQRLTNRLAAEGGVREVARLASLGLPHAGDWLHVLPSTALGLHMRPQEFVAAVKLRLGIEVYETAGPCPACQKPGDRLGDHSLCCGSQGERISRHNALRDALYATAVSAALGPTREGRFLLPGGDRRPADVFIPNWTRGRDSALDVTVTHCLQDATVAEAAVTPGHAAAEAYRRKMVASAEDCEREGIVFLPLAAESLGGWHPVAVQQVDKLAAALARHSGEEERVVTRHLWQRLAVLLQKGNSALLVNRVPSFPAPDVTGHM